MKEGTIFPFPRYVRTYEETTTDSATELAMGYGRFGGSGEREGGGGGSEL